MRSGVVTVALILAGCSGAGDGTGQPWPLPGSAVPPIEDGAPLDPAFAQTALEIAREYTAWGRVDDELRWAPFLCRQPMPAQAHVSASGHQATHGQKLYSVFVKVHADYPAASKAGQVVVKESFVPEPVEAPPTLSWNSFPQNIEADHYTPYATDKDGMHFRAGAPAGLFLMFKGAANAPGTDRGWVYATVSTAGQVTAAGRIGSCMACHEEAPHDRLFGVPQSNP